MNDPCMDGSQNQGRFEGPRYKGAAVFWGPDKGDYPYKGSHYLWRFVIRVPYFSENPRCKTNPRACNALAVPDCHTRSLSLGLQRAQSRYYLQTVDPKVGTLCILGALGYGPMTARVFGGF